MKFLLFVAIQLLALVSLSTQAPFTYEEELRFPIKAVAAIHGEVKDPLTNVFSKISGAVHFVQETKDSAVVISVDIKGLPQYTSAKVIKRGFHIHELGISVFSDNITAVCGSTGAHYNPMNETHGFLESQVRHVGDLGNLITNENGTMFQQLVDDRLSLYGKYSIIGRSVVLHDGEDDGGLKDTPLSRSAGSSGARIACGVIGYEKTEVKSISRSLLSVVRAKAIAFEDVPVSDNNNTYVSFEDKPSDDKQYFQFEDSTNNDTSSDDLSLLNDLSEFSKTLPQTREIFRLFFKILRNMMDQAQDASSQLTQSLNNFELPAVSDIQVSIVPQADALTADNSTLSQLDPNIETINLV